MDQKSLLSILSQPCEIPHNCKTSKMYIFPMQFELLTEWSGKTRISVLMLGNFKSSHPYMELVAYYTVITNLRL
jgi:hypothetical protein